MAEQSAAACKGLNNEPAWKTQGVGVGKDVYGLKDESEVTKGWFKPGMEDSSAELSGGNDWRKSAGDFSCTVCGRKRLPASEFSKRQVEKALESLKSIKDKDIRTDPAIETHHFVNAVCKTCMTEREENERKEAAAKRVDRDVVETPLEEAKRTAVSLTERPFGMTPSKTDGVGYLIAKVSDGKPAARAGIRLGWRVVAVAGEPCEDADVETVKKLMTAAALPLEMVFEEMSSSFDFCTACQRALAIDLFSRKMRTKPAEKRRCSSCVEQADADANNGEDLPTRTAQSELQALCLESAQQAETVTGLKPVRGGSAAGRGRGRGGYGGRR